MLCDNNIITIIIASSSGPLPLPASKYSQKMGESDLEAMWVRSKIFCYMHTATKNGYTLDATLRPCNAFNIEGAPVDEANKKGTHIIYRSSCHTYVAQCSHLQILSHYYCWYPEKLHLYKSIQLSHIIILLL